MRSLIVTHNIGHSVLEGFENKFAPVVLEDRSQVGLGVVIYAGCRIGAEAIVASNSYVTGDIPAGRVRDRRAREGHGQLEPPDLALAADRARAADDRRPARAPGASRPRGVADLGRGGARVRGRGRARALHADASRGGRSPREHCAHARARRPTFRRERPSSTSSAAVIHGDAGGEVLDAVREFCRKRGIRFEPGPWRYSGGLSSARTRDGRSIARATDALLRQPNKPARGEESGWEHREHRVGRPSTRAAALQVLASGACDRPRPRRVGASRSVRQRSQPGPAACAREACPAAGRQPLDRR